METPQRIIINDRCLRGPLTGVGHYVTQLLAHIPRQAPDLELFAFYSARHARKKAACSSQNAAPRARSLARRPPWLLRRTALRLYNTAFSLAGQLKRCALYHEPNHIPAPWPGPILTTIHDLSVLRHPQWHPADRVRWYDKDLHAGLDRTRHFITVSQFSKQEMIDLLDLAPDRITVIPLGVRDIFHPRPADQLNTCRERFRLPSDYFLYAGTIEPRKNVAGLLASYAALPPQIRNHVTLVLAGVTGWGRQTVDDWIARLGLAGRVCILGYVDDESLACLYAGARALVWPSLYEGFGLPPLECMASSTPVITSNLASLPEVTGDAALLVDPRDEAQLTQAMTRVIEDNQLVDTLRQEGLKRSAAFSWSQCAHDHADLYRRFLNI